MGAIRDRLNSIAKNERLFSLNELYDNQDIPWNEYFTELVKKVEVMSDEEFALYVEQGEVDAAELLLKDMEKFKLIRDGITSDYIKLSKSKVENI
jgi:hypothetical protein